MAKTDETNPDIAPPADPGAADPGADGAATPPGTVLPPADPDASAEAAPEGASAPETDTPDASPAPPAEPGSVVSVGTAAARPEPFLSEGMRDDLNRLGWAVDPSSGARFELDKETGEITVTPKQ